MPPTVVDVEVAGTSWSPAYTSYLQSAGLGTRGYSIAVGSTAQTASLTWTNIDQVIITFSEDVEIDAADLSLSGVDTPCYEFSDFHYDPQLRQATWTLNMPLNNDRLQLDLDADGLDPVRDLQGNVLDGEWFNNFSTTSGDGIAGGDFEFLFNVLPTDVNNTGTITNYDYIYIRQLDGKSTSSTGYVPKRDIDGSGLIDSTDWEEAQFRLNQALPSGAPAGASNDAPTTSGFDLVQLDNDAIDVAISLLAGFDDNESGSAGVAYSTLSNDNEALFDAAYIDTNTGEVVVNASHGASGRATITVRATDPGGLHVDSTITIDVNRENQPPLISNYYISSVGANTWIVYGEVSDPDDDVTNLIVTFFNVFDARAAVYENGHFEFAVILDENQAGWEYAVTYDPHGLRSNVPFSEVGMT